MWYIDSVSIDIILVRGDDLSASLMNVLVEIGAE